jgi:hypothetical protein
MILVSYEEDEGYPVSIPHLLVMFGTTIKSQQ